MICIGDYTGGVETKGVLINDYLEVKPSANTHLRPPKSDDKIRLKTIKWKKAKIMNQSRSG